jgi:hypothetical protein
VNDVIALIEDVLHNPNFNSEDVDTDMLKWFADSIDRGDLEIISMDQEGDGAQKLELFKLLVEKVLWNSVVTYCWLDVSTLPSRSTWILMETDCLPDIQMDL